MLKDAVMACQKVCKQTRDRYKSELWQLNLFFVNWLNFNLNITYILWTLSELSSTISSMYKTHSLVFWIKLLGHSSRSYASYWDYRQSLSFTTATTLIQYSSYIPPTTIGGAGGSRWPFWRRVEWGLRGGFRITTVNSQRFVQKRGDGWVLENVIQKLV